MVWICLDVGAEVLQPRWSLDNLTARTASAHTAQTAAQTAAAAARLSAAQAALELEISAKAAEAAKVVASKTFAQASAEALAQVTQPCMHPSLAQRAQPLRQDRVPDC